MTKQSDSQIMQDLLDHGAIRPECVKEFKEKIAAKKKVEKMIEADERGSRYLADANEFSERGNHAKAEKLYTKGQYWLDRYNKLAGNA